MLTGYQTTTRSRLSISGQDQVPKLGKIQTTIPGSIDPTVTFIHWAAGLAAGSSLCEPRTIAAEPSRSSTQRRDRLAFSPLAAAIDTPGPLHSATTAVLSSGVDRRRRRRPPAGTA